MVTKEEILSALKELKVHPKKVHNIYLYGSRLYQTHQENSDYDFIIVANNSVDNQELTMEFEGIKFNFHLQTPNYFQKRLNWNDPSAFECLIGNNTYNWETKIDFQINIEYPKLRHSVSHISSNSWVKAKKKIQQGDIYIGQKSLYHSLRIPLYMIDLITKGDINWEAPNSYWEDIKGNDIWEDLKNKYQPIRNSILSDFRKLCPKKPK